MRTSDGGTDIGFTVLNTSGGVAGGDPAAVFVTIGLDNIGTQGSAVGPTTVTMNGTSYSGWQTELNTEKGGGINVDLRPDLTNGINWGISSACGPIDKRITDGGIGGCPGGPNNVTISMHLSSQFDLGDSQLYIKAQGLNSSECIIGSICAPTVTTPEPATLTLFGTGMFGLVAMGFPRRRSKQS